MDTVPIANRCPKCAAPLPADAPQGLCPKCLLAAVSTPTDADRLTARILEPPPLAQVQAAFPQLEILDLIGWGGMGVVYKARQPKLDRFIALKLLPQSHATDAAFAERFNREARVLARLNHPNIVTVHDFGETGEFFYLLMEFVDGVNLRQAMQAGRFSPTQALGIVPRICEALQFAHEQGILHRDIKPENILLDTKGRVKIADFGIAKLIGEAQESVSLTASGAAVGTPHYMAPEQIEHPQDVDQRADIYSLGVVFYEMLTGELPIGRFAPPSEKSPVDPRVDAVVFRALEREREKRFGSANEVKTSVENIGSTPPPVAAAPPDREPALKQIRAAATALFIVGLLNCLPIVGLAAMFVGTKVLSGPGSRTTVSPLVLPFLGGLMSGPVIMIAAQMLRRLASREFAMFACALAMIPPLSPAFLLGIPVGIWCLLVLRRPEVKAAFAGGEMNPAGGPTSAPPAAPAPPAMRSQRWSGKAIAGAILAGITLVVGIPTGLALSVFVPLVESGAVVRNALPQFWMVLAAVLVGVPALVGTMLGAAALREVRVGPGQRRGAVAAMIATLAWPLVLIDLVLGRSLLWAMFWAVMHVGTALGLVAASNMAVAAALVVVAVIVIDWFAISWLWRWVKRSPPLPPRSRVLRIACATTLVCLALAGASFGSMRGTVSKRDTMRDSHFALTSDPAYGPQSAQNKNTLRWTLGMAPSQRATLTLTILSNNVRILSAPLTASLRTPSGQHVQGAFTVDLLDAGAPPVGQTQWRAHLDAGRAGQATFEFTPPLPVAIRWTPMEKSQSIHLGRRSSFDGAILKGVQEVNRGGSVKQSQWLARLRIEVWPSNLPLSGHDAELTQGQVFRVPFMLTAGQAATFTLVRTDKNGQTLYPMLGAYALAPAGQTLSGELSWVATGYSTNPASPCSWTTILDTEGGRATSGGLSVPGDWQPVPPATEPELVLLPESTSLVKLAIARDEPAESGASLGVQVRTQPHHLAADTIKRGGGGTGTNWFQAVERLRQFMK